MTTGRLEGWVTGGDLNLLYAFVTDCVSQRFCREVVVWNALRHENVLPLLGVTITRDQLVTVSEWMVGGNIMDPADPIGHADRLKLVCFSSRV